MSQDRNLQILGLAKKAGLLAIGCEAAGAAARSGKTKLIISASDASERAYRNARINADAGYAICIVVPYTKFELGNITGRGSPGTVAFLDIGLAVRFLQGLAATDPEPFGKLWEFLEKYANDRESNDTPANPGSSKPSGKGRTMQ
ncbi:MAG: hypothetical protein FWB97_09990 [Oscillospiraceae bacterium]|nr:hypothetical protein [Oscillospiraceae bacterium]